MFYGAQLKPGQTVTPSVDDGGEILHLSQICLVDPKEEGSTLVQINDGDKNYGVAVLQKGKCEHVSLDLFISTLRGIKLSTKGAKNEVHVVGYFEPEPHGDDDESDSSFMDGLTADDKIEDLDDDESDGDEDEFGNPESLMKSKNVGKKDKKIEEISDEDTHGLINGIRKDEEEEGKDVKRRKKMEKNKNSIAGGASKPNQGGVMNQKRKAQNMLNKGNEAKKQKGDAGKKAVSDETNEDSAGSIDKFKKELVKFLTVNGKTNLGTLGQKIKKPQQIEKLGQFIKEQSSLFKLENGFVSLAK